MRKKKEGEAASERGELDHQRRFFGVAAIEGRARKQRELPGSTRRVTFTRASASFKRKPFQQSGPAQPLPRRASPHEKASRRILCLDPACACTHNESHLYII